MGLIHNFVNWGIDLIDDTEKDMRRIGQRLGFMPLTWRQVVMQYPSKDGLLWRVPDPDVAMANSLSRIQAIIVSEYERALVLKDGMLTEQVILPPGSYDIRRTMQIRGQIEIIWTTTSEFQMRWGVPDVLTRDRVGIGASGYCTAAIVAPDLFLTNVAGNVQVYTREHMATFARPEVSSILRDLMARKTVMEFMEARDEFLQAAQEKLQPAFDRWGLEFRGLNIENHRIPEEFRQAAAARRQIQLVKEAELEGAQADVNLAQLEAQKRYFLAQAEATKYYVIEDAQVESMRRQLSIGMDPLRLKMAEAMETAAANPSQGSLVDSRVQIINQLSGLLNTPAPPGTPPAVPANPPVTPGPMSLVGPTNPMAPPNGFFPASEPAAPPPGSGNSGGFPSFVPPVPSEPVSGSLVRNAPSAGSTSSSETMNREKIEGMLDKLDERFANGEISEQTYLMMRDKWQKKLDQLP
ncbi:MAG TPA: SPFH domain-containing protein [Ktedonobacteraceae bacterium]|nr:SPFH domain-containing protein [Ktedonobacteraceae bacterium]